MAACKRSKILSTARTVRESGDDVLLGGELVDLGEGLHLLAARSSRTRTPPPGSRTDSTGRFW